MSDELPLRPVRTDDDADVLAFARAVSHHFFEDEPDDDLRRWMPLLAACRAWVVERDGRIVGNLANLPVDVSVPGGARLPCAGVTAVGVSQTARRRGLLRRLLTAGLDDAVEREQPVAALFASESAIYPRFGFGVAAPMVGYRVDTRHLRFRNPVDGRSVTDLPGGEAAAEIATTVAHLSTLRPGVVSRAREQERLLAEVDAPGPRDGASAKRFVHVPGRGYAVYRVRDGVVGGLPAGEVRLLELVATDAEAEQALWQHVTEVDLTTTLTAHLRPPDDALPWMVVDPLRLGTVTSAPLYVRLLDVVRCLGSRTSATRDGLVLEVVDDARDQGGRYRWDVSPEGAACTRTDADPDVVLPVEILAALWLGGTSASRLLTARRLEERTTGAVTRLDRMVATPLAPWTPWEF